MALYLKALETSNLSNQKDNFGRLFSLSKLNFEKAIALAPDSIETITTFATILKEESLKFLPGVDWELLGIAIEKYAEAGIGWMVLIIT